MKKRIKLWMARILVLILVVTQIQPMPVQAMEIGDVTVPEASVLPETTTEPTQQSEENTAMDDIVPVDEEVIIQPIAAPTFAPMVMPTEEPRADIVPIEEPMQETDLTVGQSLAEVDSAVLSATVVQAPYQNTFYSELGWYSDEIIEGLVLELSFRDGSTGQCAFGDSVWIENGLSYETYIKVGTDYVDSERWIRIYGKDNSELVEFPYYVKSVKETDDTLTVGETIAYERGRQVYKVSLEPGAYEITATNGWSLLDNEAQFVQDRTWPLFEVKESAVYYISVYGTADDADRSLSVKKGVIENLTAGTAYVSDYNANGETRWFKFVSGETGAYNIRLNDTTGVNKEFGVFKISEGTGWWGEHNGNRFTQEHLVAGNVYYIKLAYGAGASGTYNLFVERGKTVTDIKIIQMPYRTQLYYGMERHYFENFPGLKLGVTFEDGSYIEYYNGCNERADYLCEWEVRTSDGGYVEYQEYLPVGEYKLILGIGASVMKVEVPFSVVLASGIAAKLSVNSPLVFTELPERNHNNYAMVEITEPGQYIITSRSYINGGVFDSAFQTIDDLSGYGNLFEFTEAGTYYIRVSSYDYSYTVSLVRTKEISKIEAYLREGAGTYYRFPDTNAFGDAYIKVTFADGTTLIPEKYSDDWYKYLANWNINYRGTYNYPQWDQERQCYPVGEYDLRVVCADGSEYRLPIEIKEVEEYDVSLTVGEKLNIQTENAYKRKYVKVYCPEAGQYSIFMGEDTYLSYELWDSSFKRISSDWAQYCAFEADAPGYYYLGLYSWDTEKTATLSMEKLVPLTGITLHEDGEWYEYYGLTRYSRYAVGRSYTMYFQDGTKVTSDPDELTLSDVEAKYGVLISLRNPDGTYANWDETDRVPVGEYRVVVSSDGLNISDQRKYEVRDKSEITTTLKYGQTLTGLEANLKEHYVKVVFDKPGLYAFHTDAPWAYFNGFCDENNKSIYDWTFTVEGLQVDVKEPGTYYLSFYFNETSTNTYTVSLETRKKATGLKILEYQKELYDGCYLNTVSGLGLRYELTFEDGTKESFVYGDELAEKYSLVHTVYSKDDLDYSYDDWMYPVGEYVVRVESMLKGLYDFSCDLDFSVISSEKAPALVIGDVLTVQQENQLYRLSIPKTGTYEINVTTGNGWFEVFNQAKAYVYLFDTESDKGMSGELQAGEYYLVVHNGGYGDKLPITFSIASSKPVEITKQPVDVTVNNGATASVSVTATGDGLKYQWYYTMNAGSSTFEKSSNTTATYTTTMNGDRAGRKVYCVITDKNGNKVTSNTVTLKMSSELKITQQPIGVTVANGTTASVSVKVSGEGLKYQWYYTMNAGSSTFEKSSNTTATYTTSMNKDRAGRKVYCVITDKYGNKVTSNTVTLSMSSTGSIKITQQPVDVTVANGATASVSVKASGEGLKYQWYYTMNASSSTFEKSSNTTATYTTNMNKDRAGRKVYCVITDKYGNKVTSNTVTLSMSGTGSIKITQQPVDVTVANGATASVSVKVSGEGLKYQWYYTMNASSSTFEKSSNTTATYTTTMNSDRAGRKVYCVITDKNGNKVTSNTVTLSMSGTSGLKITQQPVDVTVANGTTASVIVKASGEGLKYQWYYTMNASSSTFEKSSNTTATYTTNMNKDRAGRKVYCVITDKNGNKVTSNTVTLSMSSTGSIKITQQPVDVTVANGATASVSVKASGEGLKYQWYYTMNASSSTFEKSSNTTATYTTAMNSDRAGRKVYCVITDKNGNKVNSNTVTLSMSSTGSIKITQQPVDVTVANGATASVSVKASGDGLKYQWYYTMNASNSTFEKSSNTTATYTTAMNSDRAGRKVYCVITDKNGNKVTSNTVTLSMSSTGNLKITQQPVDVTVANGTTASVSVKASGEGLKYQWYYTMNASSSTFEKSSNTTATYTTTMNSDRAGRKVYCVITDKNGNKVTSNTVTLKMSK